MAKKAKRYSEGFNVEALKIIEQSSVNISATVRQLVLPMQTLANW